MKLFSRVILTTILCFSGSAVQANDKGFNIAAQSDRSDRGFGDSLVRLKMVLTNVKGVTSQRSLVMKTMEVPNEDKGDKSILTFTSPADVRQTKLLTHINILDPDRQWLYLPALKRVKRISSSNKSGPFMGSEFAFEDFTAQELNKFDYSYIEQQSCGNRKCHVLQRKPKYKNSGYNRQLVWIDEVDLQFRRIDFYDRRNSLLKTLSFEDYKQYDGKFWRAHTLKMVNHQSAKKTTLLYDTFEFNNRFALNDFSEVALKRR